MEHGFVCPDVQQLMDLSFFKTKRKMPWLEAFWAQLCQDPQSRFFSVPRDIIFYCITPYLEIWDYMAPVEEVALVEVLPPNYTSLEAYLYLSQIYKQDPNRTIKIIAANSSLDWVVFCLHVIELETNANVYYLDFWSSHSNLLIKRLPLSWSSRFQISFHGNYILVVIDIEKLYYLDVTRMETYSGLENPSKLPWAYDYYPLGLHPVSRDLFFYRNHNKKQGLIRYNPVTKRRQYYRLDFGLAEVPEVTGLYFDSEKRLHFTNRTSHFRLNFTVTDKPIALHHMYDFPHRLSLLLDEDMVPDEEKQSWGEGDFII